MNDNRSVPGLLGDLVQQLTSLFRQEIQLARVEVQEKAAQAADAGKFIVIGALLLTAALMVFLDAAMYGLAAAGIPMPWSALIVGAVVTVVGYVLLRKGMSSTNGPTLKPEKTTEQLHRDAVTVKEKMQ